MHHEDAYVLVGPPSAQRDGDGFHSVAGKEVLSQKGVLGAGEPQDLASPRRILVTALDDGLDFNLACCECRLGDIAGAKEHLKKCFEIDPGWKSKALETPELEAVWEQE